jgi:hypothetical protein
MEVQALCNIVEGFILLGKYTARFRSVCEGALRIGERHDAPIETKREPTHPHLISSWGGATTYEHTGRDRRHRGCMLQQGGRRHRASRRRGRSHRHQARSSWGGCSRLARSGEAHGCAAFKRKEALPLSMAHGGVRVMGSQATSLLEASPCSVY